MKIYLNFETKRIWKGVGENKRVGSYSIYRRSEIGEGFCTLTYESLLVEEFCFVGFV